jgi:hypothetical protein
MPRPNLSSPHDLRFLELRPDESVKAKFRVGYFYLYTDWADLRADLRNSQFHVFLNYSHRLIPVRFTDDDLQDWLPKEDSYFVLPAKVEIASASNTNTAVHVTRHNGVTTLRARRSRWKRYFVHEHECWRETDGPETFAFIQNFPETGEICDIPF